MNTKSIPPVLPVRRNRALIAGIAVLASAGILFVFVSIINDLSLRAQKLQTLQHVKHLGGLLENFREDHGHFPASLHDPLLAADSETMKKIEAILHEDFRDTYEYQSITDGFKMKVRGVDYEYQYLTNGCNVVVEGFTNEVRVTSKEIKSEFK